MNRIETTIGDLVELFYEEYLALYGDPELARVATSATINDLVLDDYEASLQVEETEAA